MYSSDDFNRDWRFAIDVDFTNASNKPIPYASNGKQEWGDELKFIPSSKGPTAAIVNSDHSVLAVAVEQDIVLYDAKDLKFAEITRLSGHQSRIDALRFCPNRPNTLVSCAMNNRAGTVPTEPTIIIWDLNRIEEYERMALPEQDVEKLAKSAARTVTTSLPFPLTPSNASLLSTSFEVPIRQAIARATADQHHSINGRLTAGFQSNVFSPSGAFMLYLPGSRPNPNGDDRWNIRVYSMNDQKDILTLTGHRDAIMWVGYSPDEKLIGSVAWDKTSRIWNAVTGECVHVFWSKGQNWTGAFSPINELFATTCGTGTVSIYSLGYGEHIYTYSSGPGWNRAISWSHSHPNSLAVGGRGLGEIVVLDIKKKAVVQKRKLSLRRSKMDEGQKKMIGSSLEVGSVRFVGKGERERLVFKTSVDGSAEVYDLRGEGEKWRFARRGTGSYEEDGEVVENEEGAIEGKGDKEKEKPTRGGWYLEVWEGGDDKADLFVAMTDGDGVRIWRLQRDS